jgi:hypothetical protein
MVAMIDDETARLPGDDGIVQEAAYNLKAAMDWESKSDERTREDIKFANADPRNGWQWPEKLYNDRTAAGTDLPCLTVNNTRVHNDLIINSISKNDYGPHVRPVGGKASYKSAQVMENIISRIKHISKWSAQRRKVCEQQVDGGVGYILIGTRYVSNRTRNQDIYLKAARDPTAVKLDPWIKEPDGSDANFGFEFERMPRKDFNRKYPDYKNKVGASPLAGMFVEWLSDTEILLAKYYRKKQTPDIFVWYKQADGNEIEKLASEIKEESGKEIYDALIADIKAGKIDGDTRKVTNDTVEWFLIAGDTIIERGDWAGKYIPICRVVGRELVIDATLDRKGHTRPLIDAQRMLNFNASTDVQVNALQPKSPWLASMRAVEGQEQWKSANVDNFAVLMFNDVDDEAPVGLQKIEPPERINPPSVNPAYQTAMQNAERQMMMISGQFEAQMGENDTQSAASGKAINERKEQGETATYHFVEHMADMERFIGVQLLDLIPKIYDTKRTLHIQDDKGEKHWIRIDPDQTEAVQELKEEKEDEEAVKLAFNPTVGDYECVSDPGPDYATRRQEAWGAISQLMMANKELAACCADLLFKYGDFPGAEDLMERLQKEIKATKPYLFDDKVEPQVMALQQQNQRLVALNGELMTKLADASLKIRGRDELRDVESFNAETKRLEAIINAVAKLALTPQQRAQMEHEIELGAHDHVYSMIQQANAPAVTNGSGGSE